ncbi:MAG TPA: succinate dehydrogenase assembly factor 2 [Steroidobacteraceae bacterium]|nr:succinate dehydrogenase assembly factor 2 [Steroidobacteraceae bacterium]
MSLTAESRRERGRLQWRCRRGMRELDVLLERYLAEDWPQAGLAQRGAFAQLLELPDPELHGLLTGRLVPAGDAQREVIGAITRPAR